MAASDSAWGIEVGSFAIKAVRLERDDDRVTVSDFAVIPHKKVLSTPDLDQNEMVRLGLGQFISQKAIENETLVMSVPGHAAFARFAKLPPVEPKKVPDIVKFEAVQQIPFPIEDVEWDYQLFTSPDSPEVEVGIFAMTKDKVAETLALWNSTGLAPDELTISPLAAYNAIAYDLDFTDKTPGTIILDIGTTSSDLIIAEQARVWVRTFPLGGHAFTEAIQDAFKLDYAKAEKLKAEAEQSKYKKHIFQALKPVLSDLVQDVQRSITYYNDTHSDAKIDRLIGVGSTFKLFGLRKLLSQQLGMDVYRFERFKKLTVDGPAAADFEAKAINLVTAYGLALQGLGLSPLSANLVPTGVTRESVWSRKSGPLLAAAGLGLVTGGLFFLRPFLDQQQLPGDVSQLPDVRSVNSDGQRLTGAKDDIDDATTLAFAPENIEHLLSRRNLLQQLNRDVNDIIVSSRGEAPDPQSAWMLNNVSVNYVPPGEDITSTRAEPDPFGGGSGGRDDRGGRDGRGRGGNQGNQGGDDEASTAGEYGALAVTLSLDTQSRDDLNFVNRTLLPWLRDNAERSDAPYTIVGIPNIDDVQRSQARGPIETDEETEGGGGSGGGGDRGGGGRDDRGGDDRGGGDGMGGGGMGGGGMGGGMGGGGMGGGGMGGGGSGGSGGGQDDDRGPAPDGPAPQELDELAPLPEYDDGTDPARPVNRVTVTFVLQIKDLANLNQQASGDDSGDNADREDS